MADQERLVNAFCEMVRIDSPSDFEEDISKHMEERLRNLGFLVERDAHGNVIASEDGNDPLLLAGGREDRVSEEQQRAGRALETLGQRLLRRVALPRVGATGMEPVGRVREDHRPPLVSDHRKAARPVVRCLWREAADRKECGLFRGASGTQAGAAASAAASAHRHCQLMFRR